MTTKAPPLLIQKAIERIAGLDLAALPSIRCLRDHGRRVEACEAIRATMIAAVERTDIATMTIGIRDPAHNWSARGIADLTARAGFQRKARVEFPKGTRAEYRRCQRALEVMGPGTGKRAKSLRPGASWIYTDQRRERGEMVDGKFIPRKGGRLFRSKNAVRKITPGFWKALGLGVMAELQQQWHIKRLQRLRPRAASLAQATLEALMDGTPRRAPRRGPTYKAAADVPRPTPPPPMSEVAATWDELAEFRRLYDDLKRDNPTWPAADLAARADEVLRGRKPH